MKKAETEPDDILPQEPIPSQHSSVPRVYVVSVSEVSRGHSHTSTVEQESEVKRILEEHLSILCLPLDNSRHPGHTYERLNGNQDDTLEVSDESITTRL